ALLARARAALAGPARVLAVRGPILPRRAAVLTLIGGSPRGPIAVPAVPGPFLTGRILARHPGILAGPGVALPGSGVVLPVATAVLAVHGPVLAGCTGVLDGGSRGAVPAGGVQRGHVGGADLVEVVQ